MVKVYKLDSTKDLSIKVSKSIMLDLPEPLTSGSRFGSAVENLGDIHNDDYEDFAVSAPYFGDDHAGAVFIYRGQPDFNFGKKNYL